MLGRVGQGSVPLPNEALQRRRNCPGTRCGAEAARRGAAGGGERAFRDEGGYVPPACQARAEEAVGANWGQARVGMFLKRRRWRPHNWSEEDCEPPSCSRRLGSLSCRQRPSPGARPTTWSMSRPTCLRNGAAAARNSGGWSTSPRCCLWRSRSTKPAPAATSRLRGSTPRPLDCLMCAAGLKHLDQRGYGPSARRDGCTCRERPPERSTMRTSGRAASRRPARLLDAWPPEAVLHPDPQTRNRSDSSNGFALRYNAQLRRPRVRCRVAFGTHLGQGLPSCRCLGLAPGEACTRRPTWPSWSPFCYPCLYVRLGVSGAQPGWRAGLAGGRQSGPPRPPKPNRSRPGPRARRLTCGMTRLARASLARNW